MHRPKTPRLELVAIAELVLVAADALKRVRRVPCEEQIEDDVMALVDRMIRDAEMIAGHCRLAGTPQRPAERVAESKARREYVIAFDAASGCPVAQGHEVVSRDRTVRGWVIGFGPGVTIVANQLDEGRPAEVVGIDVAPFDGMPCVGQPVVDEGGNIGRIIRCTEGIAVVRFDDENGFDTRPLASLRFAE
jgi:hypothetical protein